MWKRLSAWKHPTAWNSFSAWGNLSGCHPIFNWHNYLCYNSLLSSQTRNKFWYYLQPPDFSNFTSNNDCPVKNFLRCEDYIKTDKKEKKNIKRNGNYIYITIICQLCYHHRLSFSIFKLVSTIFAYGFNSSEITF